MVSETAIDQMETYLESLNPEERALTQQTRQLIKEAIPQVTEKVHVGWRVIHYFGASSSMRDIVAALVPHRTYVNLQFGDGATLPDPAHRLEGTGKRLRHVKIRSTADVQNPDVRSLLEAAARLRGL